MQGNAASSLILLNEEALAAFSALLTINEIGQNSKKWK